MSETNRIVAIPDELLNSVVGGAFTEEERTTIRTISQQLKKSGYLYNNTMAWLHEQMAGYRFSDKDWQEIESIVKSVFEE